MRLHRLRLLAVGPFADEQVVDFDRLGAGGLFLFEGPTGVGKSTILDALTFALYGGMACDAADPARMRSDFADPHVRPEVELEFSVRGERHRITRTPEHLRPKRRGTGTTRERSSVHLQRWAAGAWTSRSHAKDEVGALVTELVGLNREQFRQVVLLPQGEFATFLRADDDQRREVLVRLFGTHFYRQVSDQLQLRAQAARVALQAADTALVTRVAAAWEAAGRAPAAPEGPLAAPVAQVAALGPLGAELDATAEVAEAAAEAAERGHGSARDALADAEQVVARLHRRAELEAVLAGAQREQEAHGERVARLAAARRAEPVRPLVALAEELSARVDLARARARDAGVDPERLAAGRGAGELAEQAARLRRSADGLAPLVAVERGFAAEQQSLAGARAELAGLQDESEQLAQRASTLPGEIAAARAEHGALQVRVAAAPARAAGLEAAVQQVRAAERADELAGELPALLRGRQEARRAAEQARDHLALLTEHRLSDLRGELAERLVNGDPCLVCGSPEHPDPARVGRLGVTEADVRHAAHARDEAEVHLQEAEVRAATAQREWDLLREAAGGTTLEQARSQHDEAVAQLEHCRSAESDVPAAAERLAALESEAVQLEADTLRLAQRIAAVHADVGHRAARVEQAASAVAAGRADFPSVAERISAESERAAALEEQATRVGELARALADWEGARARATGEAAAAGFADLAEARSAVLPAAQLGDLEAQVASWQAAVDDARALLGSPEVVAVEHVDPAHARAEVDRLRAEQAAAEQVASSARREAGVAVQQRERFAARMAEVEAAAHRRAELARDAEQVIALDHYARGVAGTPRMSLVTFVLRYWFEQVVDAANLRLAAMSAGKYQLIRVDEAARRDARVGLGLAVLDRHTGRERGPGTLSGGETFYTSLALALGLADVVVAQAGGAQLDTLFIDEGFGSLDPDTLDDVMGVLDDLRGNGRVVGIVSHVPELKERIAERLSVRRVRTDGPSTIEVLA